MMRDAPGPDTRCQAACAGEPPHRRRRARLSPGVRHDPLRARPCRPGPVPTDAPPPAAGRDHASAVAYRSPGCDPRPAGGVSPPKNALYQIRVTMRAARSMGMVASRSRSCAYQT